jgi:hypothetical protein
LEAEENDHGVYMGDNEGFGAYFVDKCGYGDPGEPALTLDEFIRRMKPGLGYGMSRRASFRSRSASSPRTTSQPLFCGHFVGAADHRHRRLCARAARGHATAPPSVAKNFRRPMWLAM